jgi:predicted NUDIX family NTP pyrophosphohydrolase
VHPGGPFFKNKDLGAWTIPKGEFSEDEIPLIAAQREFAEETGSRISGEFIRLTPIRQKSGKKVLAWAVEGDLETEKITSNTFEIEWPPKSGEKKSFPEIDKAEWFNYETAKEKINPAQISFLEEVIALLK